MSHLVRDGEREVRIIHGKKRFFNELEYPDKAGSV